jgi:hypothetical protein
MINMKRILKLTAIAFSVPVFFNLTNPPAVKAENQFDVCLREIVNSGVAVEQANTACADALIPRDLSYCVQAISKNTAIAPEDALKNCYLVRRPVDMAKCVVNINQQILTPTPSKTNSPPETKPANSEESTEKPETSENTEITEITEITDNPDNPETDTSNQESPLMLALETCTSTVLPARHSECVIGLSRTPQPMSPVKAMESCINAEDFPRDLFSDN